jgi:hypothetical protein
MSTFILITGTHYFQAKTHEFLPTNNGYFIFMVRGIIRWHSIDY